MNVFLIDRADDGPIGGDRYFFIFAIKKYSRVTCEKYFFIYIYICKQIGYVHHRGDIASARDQLPIITVSFA